MRDPVASIIRCIKEKKIFLSLNFMIILHPVCKFDYVDVKQGKGEAIMVFINSVLQWGYYQQVGRSGCRSINLWNELCSQTEEEWWLYGYMENRRQLYPSAPLSYLKHLKFPHSLYKPPNILTYSNCLVTYDSKHAWKKNGGKKWMHMKLGPWYHLERKSTSSFNVMQTTESVKSQNLGGLK